MHTIRHTRQELVRIHFFNLGLFRLVYCVHLYGAGMHQLRDCDAVPVVAWLGGAIRDCSCPPAFPPRLPNSYHPRRCYL